MNTIQPICPVCKSTNTKDASIREDNGIIGPGYASWLVSEKSVCNDCGVFFKMVENKPENDSLSVLRIFLHEQRKYNCNILEDSKKWLANAATDGNDIIEPGLLAAKHEAEKNFIDFLYTHFPELNLKQ